MNWKGQRREWPCTNGNTTFHLPRRTEKNRMSLTKTHSEKNVSGAVFDGDYAV
jgi:hypothetical protein